ncbi:MAG: pantoate--beta-alanine ligase [Planctomycetota bacterium]|nr:pantoate--beta-alanine ligase [Planctomycetota bacterium]MCX8039421.1 pantoate--beta-alanine ligase [Planctomycetota bacterium]MDW8373873.1 pantoate--beta-alanine ligase [Planctomycetota bacterium]
MEVLVPIADMRQWSRAQLQRGARIGFVPTMGALHAGHLSLVQRARQLADRVVVSIFVNPTQFDNQQDLATYPRTLDEDLALCRQAGVDVVWTPETAEMYPDGYCTFVEMYGPLTDKLCAIARPGHFRGVCTVVTKLLAVVRPDVAIFGQKDLQQALIVSRMVADLNLGVEIVVAPTVRDRDGLALSSRNRRLTPAMRAKALALPRGLELARRAYRGGETESRKLIEIVAEEVLVNEGVDLDYCDVVSLPGFQEAERADDRCVLAAAVFVDGVRLIDHVPLAGEAIPVAIDDDERA